MVFIPLQTFRYHLTTILTISFLLQLLTSIHACKPKIEVRVGLILNKYAEFQTTFASDDFLQLLTESKISVDKTLLLKEILRNFKDAREILITLPRKWGKTTNLKMLSSFLEIQVDSQGNPLPPKVTKAYQLFKYGVFDTDKSFEKALLISKEDDIINTHLGQYPVIHITFLNIEASNFNDFKDRLRGRISSAFRQHLYLLDVYKKLITQNEGNVTALNSTNRIIHKFVQHVYRNASDTDTLTSLKFLSEMLYRHFNKKVFILIDEYDSPVKKLITNEEFEEDKTSSLNYYYDFLRQTLRNNEFLEKAVVTGILKLSKLYNASSLTNTNIKECNFWYNPLFLYYGFNAGEAKLLFDKCNVTTAKELTAIHYWYEGYKTGLCGLQIFNPWTINEYLQERVFQGYWEGGTGSIAPLIPNLMKNPAFAKVYNDMLDKGLLYTANLTTLECTEEHYEIVRNPQYYKNTSVENVHAALKYLLGTGYLTFAQDYDVESPQHIIKLPNYEIKSHFEYYRNLSNLEA